MSRRTSYGIGALLLVVFAGFAFASFKSSLSQYVDFEQAMRSTAGIQVAGALEQGSSDYDTVEGALRFTIVEPETGKTLRVRYHGVKPGNFEDAVSVVAVGRWDASKQEIAAERLLVKCPSKYQGAEVDNKSYG